MTNKTLISIEYIPEITKNQVTLIENNNSKLSPISKSIVDAVFSKKIIFIFSQGPLNLASTISGLFALQKEQDVLIGIPKTLFNETYKINTQIFFSLLSRVKMPHAIDFTQRYFFNNMLWCKGKIDEEENTLTELDIETRPKHGTSRYVYETETDVIKKLRDGTFQKTPKIVSIPIDDTSPAGIIGKKLLRFKTEDYKLDNFKPGLVIYDSVNERRFNFDTLVDLINNVEKMDVTIVLHFSWPYLKGLSNFLEKIKGNTNICVLHLGKRFCIESMKNFEKPPKDIISLSLEGNLWNIYYPKSIPLNFEVLLPTPNINNKCFSLHDIEDIDWPFDEKVRIIRKCLEYNPIDGLDENILRFPPVIDTFLSPSEIKRSSFMEGKNSWISLPIKESISVNSDKDNGAIKSFTSICSDLERYRDISYNFNGLYTNLLVSKKTLLQAVLIERFVNKLIKDAQSGILEYDKTYKTTIIIANFYPYLGTQAPLFESLNYLFRSIKSIVNNLKISIALNRENTVDIDVELSNGSKCKEIFFKNYALQEKNINNIKKFLSINNVNVNLSIDKYDNQIDINITIPTLVEYLEFGQQKSEIFKKYFEGLTIYKAVIKYNNSFEEFKVSNISLSENPKNQTVTTDIEYRNTSSYKKSIKNEFKIVCTELSKLQTFPQEIIKESELLIPGPIPFHTISSEDILISHGYDALLHPFRKITFFAYPGDNFKRLMKQINLYSNFFSENQTDVSRRDLAFSIDNIWGISGLAIPQKPTIEINSDDTHVLDTPIDTAVRKELLNESNVDEDEREEIKTLKDVWASIPKNSVINSSIPSSFVRIPKEDITVEVVFETGKKETLLFPIDLLIRKKIGREYVISPIGELSENDQIIYIQTEERDSVENYLLRTFNEDNVTLEEILNPLICIKVFYEVLNSIDFKYYYRSSKMKKIDWLSEEKKENLYNLFKILLDKEPLMIDEEREEVASLSNNSIWQGLVSPEILTDIFNGSRAVTYSKLYELAKRLGLKYEESSFKALCSVAINEQKHYSFLDENNLLVIGRLIGHQEIIDNYQIINEKGSKVRTFLQQVGCSIKRVVNGMSDPFNEMDITIEGKMKRCTIIKICDKHS